MATETTTAVYINNFTISNDGTTIGVHVETAAGYYITDLNFWTDATFQDYAQKIDLTPLLTQTSNVEIFDIAAVDVGLTSFFDGIFFGEFRTDAPTTGTACNECVNGLGVASKLIAAKICLLEKVLAIDVCSDCKNACTCIDKCDIINLDNFIDSMSIAIQFGFYSEAIDLLNSIRKLCSNCDGCLDSDEYSLNTGLGYYTLNNTLVLG